MGDPAMGRGGRDCGQEVGAGCGCPSPGELRGRQGRRGRDAEVRRATGCGKKRGSGRPDTGWECGPTSGQAWCLPPRDPLGSDSPDRLPPAGAGRDGGVGAPGPLPRCRGERRRRCARAAGVGGVRWSSDAPLAGPVPSTRPKRSKDPSGARRPGPRAAAEAAGQTGAALLPLPLRRRRRRRSRGQRAALRFLELQGSGAGLDLPRGPRRGGGGASGVEGRRSIGEGERC